MNNALIQALPSETRNVPDLLSLEPGVLYLPTLGASEGNPGGDSRSGAVNGIRSDQGNVTIDGVDDNDQVFGYAFTGVLRETQDSVEEFRVATSNTNSDEGRSAGAQVSLITKSGTNKFHGAAYEYNRPTFTVSNDWFVKQAQLNSSLPNVPPKLIRNIFGGAVGGPIIKDKLFFFGNYEGNRQAEDQVVVQTTPTASYDAGVLSYPGGGSLTPAQVAQLDAPCVSAGGCETAQYAPGPGPNPNALAYFKSMPIANGETEGDGGFNSGSYTFASPNPVTLNTSIGRIDWTPSEKHRIFARGGLQKDTTGVCRTISRPASFTTTSKTTPRASSAAIPGPFRRTWSTIFATAMSARETASAGSAPATSSTSASCPPRPRKPAPSSHRFQSTISLITSAGIKVSTLPGRRVTGGLSIKTALPMTTPTTAQAPILTGSAATRPIPPPSVTRLCLADLRTIT